MEKDVSQKNLETRIRQLLYDRGLAKKQGIDVEGESYAPVRNELKRLRDQLKGSSLTDEEMLEMIQMEMGA